jgi:hypothetical protein
MSTLTVTTVQTANGSTDLTLQTGNTSAGRIVIPASGDAINVSANVIVNGTMSVYSSFTANGSFNVNGTLFSNTIVSNRVDDSIEGGQLTLRRSVDNADMYGIDVNGSGSTPNLRIFNSQASTELFKMTSAGNVEVVSNNLILGTRSIAANGYSRLPNGLLMQWGSSPSIGQDSSGSVTFPIAFTTLYCIQITPRAPTNNGGGGADNITANSTTGFTISHGADGTATFYWMAIGV